MKYPYSRLLHACRTRLLLPLWIMLFVLAGCSTPVTQYYVLSTTPAKHTAEKTAAAPMVTIRQVEIPHYLDRPRMVSRDDENHLRISEYHQWGGRLRDNLANTLSDDLAERMGSVTVPIAPFPDSINADISVLVDFRQFERLADGYMHLRVRWLLQRSGETVQRRYEQFQSDTSIAKGDFAGMAAAMSQLLGLLADHMAMLILNVAPMDKE